MTGWEFYEPFGQDPYHPVTPSFVKIKKPSKKRTLSKLRKRRNQLILQFHEKGQIVVCGYCGCCFDQLTKYTLDHIIPLSLGGSSSIENLVLACFTCNNIKSNALQHVKFGVKKGCSGCKVDKVIK